LTSFTAFSIFEFICLLHCCYHEFAQLSRNTLRYFFAYANILNVRS
uniref:Ovule protein n=1 Tax=Brugia timori TaxID=42155 RepID=A0A0R3R8E0_9BILA